MYHPSTYLPKWLTRKHWITLLWRLTSPKICRVNWEAGDLKDLTVQSSLKTGGLQTQGELLSQFKFKGRKKLVSQFEGSQTGRRWSSWDGQTSFYSKQSVYLFHSGLQVFKWTPPLLRRTICSTQSTDLNANHIQNTHRNTQNKIRANIWALHGS